MTFADQTATAIENARLYTEVRAFSEVLEARVRARTAELERANAEIERALRELGDAQGQLIHSEKMAGLGMLVAGIAHEVNSPAAAVQGLGRRPAGDRAAARVTARGSSTSSGTASGLGARSSTLIDGLLPDMMASAPDDVDGGAAAARRLLRSVLAGAPGANEAAAMLAELGADRRRASRPSCRALAGDKNLVAARGVPARAGVPRPRRGEHPHGDRFDPAHRRRAQALLRLDEAPLERVDVHAGIEDTLVILSHQLKYGGEWR